MTLLACSVFVVKIVNSAFLIPVVLQLETLPIAITNLLFCQLQVTGDYIFNFRFEFSGVAVLIL